MKAANDSILKHQLEIDEQEGVWNVCIQIETRQRSVYVSLEVD